MAKKQAGQPDESGPRGDVQGEPGQGDPNVQAAAAGYADPVPEGEAVAGPPGTTVTDRMTGDGELIEREITDGVGGEDNV